MMVSTTDILNLLRAKPRRFVLDIAGDELPMKEGDDSDVVFSDNGREYRVAARIKQTRDLEKQGDVVTQLGRGC
jgi:hypothetical protein